MTTTTHPPAMLLKQLLINNSLGVDGEKIKKSDIDSDWPIYVSHEPDGKEIKDDIITIYDTAGAKDGRLMEGPIVQHPGNQVRVRSRSYTEGWARARLIFNLFETVVRTPVIVESIAYNIQNISLSSSILPLGIPKDDTKRRDLFTLNALLTINEEE